jgi:hypothetical protein
VARYSVEPGSLKTAGEGIQADRPWPKLIMSSLARAVRGPRTAIWEVSASSSSSPLGESGRALVSIGVLRVLSAARASFARVGEFSRNHRLKAASQAIDSVCTRNSAGCFPAQWLLALETVPPGIAPR